MFLDRLFFRSESRMAGKLAAPLFSAAAGVQALLLIGRISILASTIMHIVGSQYWNQVHGFSPDDIRIDKKGLQTMRTLAQNMAWMPMNIQSGKEQNIPFPQ